MIGLVWCRRTVLLVPLLGVVWLGMAAVSLGQPPPRPPAASGASVARAEAPEGLYAELRTSKGLIVLRLEFERAPMTVRYMGRYLDGRPFASSADEGRPIPGAEAQTFAYIAGKTRITPGLDEALLEMRPGEKRTIIVQGQLGYGRSGFVAREKPGEKRFVISPNTTLMYEVELVDIKR